MKTLEEKASLSRRLLQQAREHGSSWMERNFEERLQEAEKHAGVIREQLLNNTQAEDISLEQANGHKTKDDADPE